MSITLRRPSDEEKPEKKEKAKEKAQPLRLSRPAPKAEDIRLGGEPRVDLLPPEVRADRRNRRTRRAFGWGVLVVAIAVVLAVVGAFALDVVAQAQLLSARAHSAELVTQQRKFAGVRDVQKQVALAEAAQQSGAATEIDWKPFLDKVSAAQPAGLALTSITVDSASPIAVYQQSTDPLQGARVGTVTIVVSSQALPDVPAWVLALQKVPGVVDAVPGTVNLDQTSHVYTATATLHVDDSLYTKRFEPKDK